MIGWLVTLDYSVTVYGQLPVMARMFWSRSYTSPISC
jgi:hypothetical protein